MNGHEVAKEVSATVVREELRILRSISMFSLGAVVLYVFGYVWRTGYFSALGVPHAVLEYPFPDILIPSLTVVVLIGNAVVTFVMLRYRSFYTKERRLRRAKMMGLSYPLNELLTYALQKSADPDRADCSNHAVFVEALTKHATGNAQADPDWKFDEVAFKEDVIKLFPDLAAEMADSFVSYELQLFVMEGGQLRDVVGDSLGEYPKGSHVYDKVSIYVSVVALLFFGVGLLLATAEALPTILAVLLGTGIGIALCHMSEVEDRYQFWHTIWVAIAFLILLNYIDGYYTGSKRRVQHSFPSVTVIGTDGVSCRGFLLAEFSDAYVIDPLDMDASCRCVKLNKQEVKSLVIGGTRPEEVLEHNPKRRADERVEQVAPVEHTQKLGD